MSVSASTRPIFYFLHKSPNVVTRKSTEWKMLVWKKKRKMYSSTRWEKERKKEKKRFAIGSHSRVREKKKKKQMKIDRNNAR
jgi:hypothetical protein